MERSEERNFEIIISHEALKKIKQLQKTYIKKLDNLFNFLKENPKPWKFFDLKKIEGLEEVYRIRLGKIRVIYEIFWKDRKIFIMKVEFRGKAYKGI